MKSDRAGLDRVVRAVGTDRGVTLNRRVRQKLTRLHSGASLHSGAGLQPGGGVVRTLALAALLFVPSCATQSLERIEQNQSDLMRRMQRAILLCEGDPVCIAKTREEYQKINAELEKLRLQILREEWEDARKTRDALIKLLQSLVDKFPELQKLLEDLLKEKEKDEKGTGEGQIDATPKPIGNGNPSNPASKSGGGAALLSPITAYDFSGYFNFDTEPLAGHYELSGSITVAGNPTSSGFSGTITSGKVIVGLASGLSMTFPVNTSYKFPSTINTDAAGNGTMYLVLGMDPITSMGGAEGASVNPITAVSIPVTRDAGGGLHFSFPQGLIRQLFPYTPWVASDYDGDGTLDFAADYSAFLQGWAAHEIKADINLDGLWTEADVAHWTSNFQEDLDNQ